MAVVGKLVAAHRHVPLALAQGSAHITCLGCSNVWQCIEALLSSPCLHTPSDISCPATCAGAGNFGVGKGSWQPPWTLCVALPRITIKRMFCRMLHVWSASSETCWQLLYFSVTSVQPLCSHAGFADWSVKLFLWLNDRDYAIRHLAHQHPHFQLWLYFFLETNHWEQ